jgi:hypothetical protein
MAEDNGGAAFPHSVAIAPSGDVYTSDYSGGGMSLRQWYAGQALSNPVLCTGEAKDWQLVEWFGKNASGIRREQIVAKQAFAYADFMLSARKKEAGT